MSPTDGGGGVPTGVRQMGTAAIRPHRDLSIEEAGRRAALASAGAAPPPISPPLFKRYASGAAWGMSCGSASGLPCVACLRPGGPERVVDLEPIPEPVVSGMPFIRA